MDGEDEILDSWEDFEENEVLDKQIQAARKEPKNKNKDKKDEDFTSTGKLLEDTERTTYTPTVKILKRQPDQNASASTKTKKVTPVKSLEQRQADYNEARRRIMGSGDPAKQEQGNTELAIAQRPAHLIQRVEEMRVSDNILRQPKGPDGSTGFNGKR